MTRRNWRSHAGLPDDRVTCIVQDRDGYLWATTHGGLARFNGWDFKAITAPELPLEGRTRMRDLCAARDGSLWAVFDGSRLVSWQQGRVRIFDRTQGLPASGLSRVVEASDGAILVGSYQGIITRIAGDQVSFLGAEAGLAVRTGAGCLLAVDTNGILWCINGGALRAFRNGRFEKVADCKDSDVLFPTRDGGLLISSSRNLRRFHPDTGFVEPARTPPGFSEIRALHEDSRGTVWIGTRSSGLFRQRGDTIEPVPISHRGVAWIGEDREENLWVATEGNGIEMLRPAVVRPVDTEGGLGLQRWSVAVDGDGALWTVGEGFNVSIRSGDTWHRFGRFGTVGSPRVTCVASAPDGSIYLAGHNGAYHVQGDSITPLDTKELGSFVINALQVARNGDVWVGFTANRDGHGVARFRRDGLRQWATPGNVRGLAESEDGAFLATTAGGRLLRFHGDTLTELPVPDMTSFGSVRAFVSSPDGSLWFGFAGGGLARLKEGHFVRATEADGLPDGFISQLIFDGDGHLWMGSNRGVSRLTIPDFEAFAARQTGRLQLAFFGRSEGEFVSQAALGRQPGCARGPDGVLYFTTHRHVLAVHPKARPLNRLAPPVVIEALRVDGTALPPNSQNLRLQPGHTRVEIDFAALSYASPENVQFRHRLEGYDANWIEAGPQRQTVYSRLPAGSYRFRVMACNNDGVWNEQGATLAFSVSPFFWDTWWFSASMVAGALGVGLLVSRRIAHLRYRRQLQELEQQQVLARDRARIAQDMHDDLGSSLMHLALLSELAKGRHVDSTQKEENLEKIGDSARAMVKTLDQLVWAVNPRNDSLPEVASYLGQQALDFLRAANVRCLLDISDEFPNEAVAAAIRHSLLLAVREALHNIVKHAAATEVHFRLRYQAPFLTVEIRDNGRGFDLQQIDGSGDGLSNFHARMASVGGECVVQSSPGAGTSLLFRVDLTVNLAGLAPSPRGASAPSIPPKSPVTP